MKNIYLIAILAIALTACGSNTTTPAESTTDSTSVKDSVSKDTTGILTMRDTSKKHIIDTLK